MVRRIAAQCLKTQRAAVHQSATAQSRRTGVSQLWAGPRKYLGIEITPFLLVGRRALCISPDRVVAVIDRGHVPEGGCTARASQFLRIPTASPLKQSGNGQAGVGEKSTTLAQVKLSTRRPLLPAPLRQVFLCGKLCVGAPRGSHILRLPCTRLGIPARSRSAEWSAFPEAARLSGA
jgi:hypothetical protein